MFAVRSTVDSLAGNCVARALYDNIAETPDELAFRKGDILTVLEQNTGGLEGWWLCSLRGRQGICPANRLRLVPRVYDTGTGEFSGSTAAINGLGSSHLHAYASSPLLNSSGGSRSSSSSSSSSSAGGGSPGMGSRSHAKPGLLNAAVRAHQQKQLLQDHSHKVFGRQAQNFAFNPPDADTYDLPPAQPRPLVPRQDCYEVPRSHAAVVSADYDVPRRHHLPMTESVDSRSCDYDVPRAALDTYDSPRSHHDARTTPAPILSAREDVLPQMNRLSDRSSGVSTFSSGSSEGSAISNVTSTSSESLSLSSALGIGANSSNPSGRSSRCSFDVCDGVGSRKTPQPSVELYDMPKVHNQTVQETYDVPPAAKEVAQDPVEVYDVPKPASVVKALAPAAELYDTPPAARKTCDSASIDGHAASRLPDRDAQETYDVPPASNLANRLIALRIANETYDSPKAPSSGPSRWPADDVATTAEQIRPSLPLELDSAMETLSRLESEITGSLSHLLGLWRYGGESIQQTELQLRSMRLRSSLQELVDFGKGAMGNAVSLKSGDDQVMIRLSRLVRSLQDASAIILKTTSSWSATMFTARRRTSPGGPDELDQLRACCLNLGQDVRLVTEFIRSNGHLLFTSPVHVASEGAGRPPSSETSAPADDYDYVNLESKAKFDEENEEVKRTLPHDMKRGFDVLVRQSESVPVLPAASDKVSDSDRNVVEFYGSQAETYMVYLTNAIDAFILTIEHNQPPKVFVAYSKFVILNAHKLLCIGDTVHRNVGNAKLKATVLERSNQLCQGLQTCVQSTKRAGREFPSVSAVQSMLDSVMAVSKLARSLKSCIVQAAGRA